ncbi:MAG: hypothetical protein ABEH59_07190 [Halobacteriales archaeon]
MASGPRLLGIIILVVIAGCSSVTGGVDPVPVTVTAAEVPEVTSESGPTPHAVTAREPEGFAAPEAQAAAHAAVLDNTSYSLVVTQQFEFPNANRSGDWRLAGQFDERDRFRVAIEKNGSVFGTSSPTRVVYWSNGTRVLHGTETSQGEINITTRRDLAPPRRALPIDPRFERELARVLSISAITDVTPVHRAGQEYDYVRVTLTGPIEPSRPPPSRATLRIQNLSARFVIDGRGLIHRIHLQYTGAMMGEPVFIRRSIQYGAIGSTTVERPEWVRAARNRTGTRSD